MLSHLVHFRCVSICCFRKDKPLTRQAVLKKKRGQGLDENDKNEEKGEKNAE